MWTPRASEFSGWILLHVVSVDLILISLVWVVKSALVLLALKVPPRRKAQTLLNQLSFSLQLCHHHFLELDGRRWRWPSTPILNPSPHASRGPWIIYSTCWSLHLPSTTHWHPVVDTIVHFNSVHSSSVSPLLFTFASIPLLYLPP